MVELAIPRLCAIEHEGPRPWHAAQPEVSFGSPDIWLVRGNVACPAQSMGATRCGTVRPLVR